MAARMATALLATLFLAGGAAAAAPRANDGEWLAYGHDGRLDNAVVSPAFRPSTVPNLRERWRAQLDGTVVASPLFTGGVLYVATQGGSVYALAAADGHLQWQQTTGTTPACGGFPFGISSTGAIDRARGLLYEIGADAELDGSFLCAGVGNSHVFDEACGCFLDNVLYGDRLVKLTPDLRVVQSNYPPGINPQGDQDFGSAPLLFQPHGCPPLAAANNKDGLRYIWDRTKIAAAPRTSFIVSD